MTDLNKELELLSIIVSISFLGALIAPAVAPFVYLAVIIGIPFGSGYAVASLPIPFYLLVPLEVIALFFIGFFMGAYFATKKAEAKLYRKNEIEFLWFYTIGLLVFSLGIGFGHSWNEWGRLIAPGIYLLCLVGIIIGGRVELLRYRPKLEQRNIQVSWP